MHPRAAGLEVGDAVRPDERDVEHAQLAHVLAQVAAAGHLGAAEVDDIEVALLRGQHGLKSWLTL